MLNSYVNQTAEYKQCTGADGRGQPTYGKPIILPCRKQCKTVNVLTPTGQTITVQHVYYLSQSVSIGDMLDGKVIMTVMPWTGLGGKTIGYKAMMQ